MSDLSSLAALASAALKSNIALANAITSTSGSSGMPQKKSSMHSLEAPIDLDSVLRPYGSAPNKSTGIGLEAVEDPFGQTLRSGPWNVTVTDNITINDCASILTADALTLLRADEGLSETQIESPDHQHMMSLLLKKERDNIGKRMAGRPPVLACGTTEKTPKMDAAVRSDSRLNGPGLQSLKVGGFLDDFTIYFWRNGAIIKFYVDGDTFVSQEQFTQTERAFALSAKAWTAILPQGTEFRRVYTRVRNQTISSSTKRPHHLRARLLAHRRPRSIRWGRITSRSIRSALPQRTQTFYQTSLRTKWATSWACATHSRRKAKDRMNPARMETILRQSCPIPSLPSLMSMIYVTRVRCITSASMDARTILAFVANSSSSNTSVSIRNFSRSCS